MYYLPFLVSKGDINSKRLFIIYFYKRNFYEKQYPQVIRKDRNNSLNRTLQLCMRKGMIRVLRSADIEEVLYKWEKP